MRERVGIGQPIDFDNGIQLVTNAETVTIFGTEEVKGIFGERPIIIIGPHPDDPELSMGVMVSLLVSAGNQIKIVSATSGPDGVSDQYILEKFGNKSSLSPLVLKAKVRIDEGRKAAVFLGAGHDSLDINVPEVLGDNGFEPRHGHSRKFGEISDSDKDRIRSFILENIGAVWFLPYPFKSSPHHGVHERVGLEFIKSLVESGYDGDVWFYETRERRQLFYRDGMGANAVVPFDEKQMKLKFHVVSLFDSQVSRDPKYYLDITEKRNARMARNYGIDSAYAEGFVRGTLRKSS